MPPKEESPTVSSSRDSREVRHFMPSHHWPNARTIGERPIQSAGWAFRFTKERDYLLHELHELIFGFLHHLGRDGGFPTFLGHPLHLFAGHGTNEVWNIFQPLLGFA